MFCILTQIILVFLSLFLSASLLSFAALPLLNSLIQVCNDRNFSFSARARPRLSSVVANEISLAFKEKIQIRPRPLQISINELGSGGAAKEIKERQKETTKRAKV